MRRYLWGRRGNISGGFGVTYSIDYSCRFNSADSPYLSFTPGGDGNSTKKFTIGMKFKIGNLLSGTNISLFSVYDDDADGQFFRIFIGGSDKKLYIAKWSKNYRVSTQVFKDIASWYDLLIAFDTTQSTSSNRLKVYTNGSEITDWDTENDPSLDEQPGISRAYTHYIGQRGTSAQYFNGSIAEFYFIDGQQLTPSYFGEISTVSGEWIPTEYTGAYGVNGAFLDFSNSSDFGEDQSVNGNDWTGSGIVSNDQLTDTPTDNHCVWNVLKPSSGTFANSNLDVSGSEDAIGTFGRSSGKWAWEITASENGSFGIEAEDGTEYTAVDSSGEVIEFELDLDSLTLKKRVNGGGLETVEASIESGHMWFPLAKAACSADFGQVDFTPTDNNYSTLCTSNLPTPTYPNPDSIIDAIGYEGDGTSSHDIDSANFSANLISIKNRDQADSWHWHLSNIGSTYFINPDSSSISTENTNSITSINNDGFTLGTGINGWNDNGENFISFLLKEDSSYIDIVTYEGNGFSRSINHGLGATPNIIITMNIDNTRTLAMYHDGIHDTPENYYVPIDSDIIRQSSSAHWSNTKPTSSVFTVGTHNDVNESGYTMYALLFKNSDGLFHSGYYEGNASTDGPFIYCGLKPKIVIIRRVTNSGYWMTYNSVTSTYNTIDSYLRLDVPQVEATSSTSTIDIVSNGFKIRSTDLVLNANGSRYIFIAFSDASLKYANAR